MAQYCGQLVDNLQNEIRPQVYWPPREASVLVTPGVFSKVERMRFERELLDEPPEGMVWVWNDSRESFELKSGTLPDKAKIVIIGSALVMAYLMFK